MDVDSEEANHLLISLMLGGLKASQSSGQVMSCPQPSCGCGDGGWREYILCVRLFLGGVVGPSPPPPPSCRGTPPLLGPRPCHGP